MQGRPEARTEMISNLRHAPITNNCASIIKRRIARIKSSEPKLYCAGSHQRTAPCIFAHFIPLAEETGLIVPDRVVGAENGLRTDQKLV